MVLPLLVTLSAQPTTRTPRRGLKTPTTHPATAKTQTATATPATATTTHPATAATQTATATPATTSANRLIDENLAFIPISVFQS